MMAADSLHVAVHLIVPSGVSFRWLVAVSSRVQCGVHSHRTSRCLRRSRPTCRRLASNAPGLRPSPRSPARWLLAAAAPPGRRCPERQRGAKAEGKTKGRGTGPRRKPVCTWGWRGTQRLRRRAACGARPAPMQGMSACFARPDTPELAGSAAMTDRRDDDFRVRPSAPKNRGKGQGQSFVSKVLKQAGKASSGKSAVRRPAAAAAAPASGPARAWGAATRRRASPGRSSRPCRGA